MNEKLCAAAGLVAGVEELARGAALCLPEEPGQAKELAARAGKDAGQALAILKQLGGTVADGRKPAPPVNPLAELSRLERSRTEALALLEALRAALPAAEALDEARGDVLPAPVLGSRGLVWSEDLVQMVARLELELFGPAGSVTGSRE